MTPLEPLVRSLNRKEINTDFKWLVENVELLGVLGLICVGILIGACWIGACWLLGQTGLMARKGFVQKRPSFVLMPVALWIVGYGVLYQFVSLNAFLLSLLLLIPVVMGFFGYFFKMGSD